MKAYVLYHANCYDGFGAAWAAWKALGDDVTYLPVTYGQPMPEIPDGSDVCMVDFSYSRDELIALEARCALRVLDHHKTAEDNLRGLPFALFDMDESGAVLTWKYFHSQEPVPMFLSYIEDRDLWRFRLPQSREVADALRAYPMDFRVWSALADDPGGMERLKAEGAVVLRFTENQVAMMCKQARIEDVGAYDVPVVNATAFWSEIGEYLLQQYPDYPFAAAYFDRADGKRQWSLRSRPDFDVSVVARGYGGGGHKQAAGFETVNS